MKDQWPEKARAWLSQPQSARLMIAVAQEVFEEASARVLCATVAASVAASGESSRPLPTTGFRVRDINFIIRAEREPPLTVRALIEKGPFTYSVDDEAPVRIDDCTFTTWGELRRLARSDEREPPRTARTPARTTETQGGVRTRIEDAAPTAIKSFSLPPWNPHGECAHE